MTDVGDFPGGMPTYYRRNLEWVRHATEIVDEDNLAVGATVDAFDTAFDPDGPRVREVLEPTFMTEADGILTLTDRGMAELQGNWATKTDTSFGNVTVSGTLAVTGAATFAATASFAGPVTFPSNAVSGVNPSGFDGIIIDGPAPGGLGISGKRAGLNRWRVLLGNATAETGTGNAGSDFNVSRFTDAGAQIDIPLSISRASANVTLTGALSLIPATSTALIVLNKPTPTGVANYLWGQTAGQNRWRVGVGNGASETGSGNVGSDFDVSRFSDAGAFIDTPLTISRASGQATFGGQVFIAPAAGSATLFLNKPAGAVNAINAWTNGVIRWQMLLGDNTAESGSNAGSNFSLGRFNDAGAAIDNPLTINRASGAVTFGGGAINAVVNINATAGSSRNLAFMSAGSLRWQWIATNTPESGGNAGSNLSLGNYSDAGAPLATPISVLRSSSVVTFAVAIVNGPSDRSLKENVRNLTGSLDRVLQLQGVSFNFIGDPAGHIGLIAQDVQPIVPEVMQDYISSVPAPDGQEGEMVEIKKLAIDYPKLTALLIEAVKELTARVEAIEQPPPAR